MIKQKRSKVKQAVLPFVSETTTVITLKEKTVKSKVLKITPHTSRFTPDASRQIVWKLTLNFYFPTIPHYLITNRVY